MYPSSCLSARVGAAEDDLLLLLEQLVFGRDKATEAHEAKHMLKPAEALVRETADEPGPSSSDALRHGIESNEAIAKVFEDLRASAESGEVQDLQKLEQFKQQAATFVETYVSLISETSTDQEIIAAMRASTAGRAT